ncbi:MAG: HAD-IG family 5'-nucleotidase [Acidimicrobiaceae bacterium]|nr:HAD-IG family 5'-nucleotidase [Acidimicrobiaceae bacterium]MYC43638.1 HAD-IG family 5'-nucleotidase [Acidimicrobiaceae bacterium]
MTEPLPERQHTRGVFCNRTLNLRGVRAIGYDMDYTLIHYFVDEWERAAFDHGCAYLEELGWPVADLVFDPEAFTLGLTFDLELGNIVKATRFGYVVRAQHGNQMLPFAELRRSYSATVIDLSDQRFKFMNTLFELSRASLWCQLVDRHDRSPLPSIKTYRQLYRIIDTALVSAHRDGSLKAAIVSDPKRFVDLDPETVPTLMDQRLAGKDLILITNSDWSYSQQIMNWCFNRFMPEGQTWRDLFDLIIVAANKPRFFSDVGPIYEVVDPERGLLEPHLGAIRSGAVYHGGNARLVEDALGHEGSQFLYVGDHLFGDVYVTKDVLRWRTALIVRELEDEISASANAADTSAELAGLMEQKGQLELAQSRLRMQRRHLVVGDKPPERVDAAIEATTTDLAGLDERIAPLARAASEQGNLIWGPLMRAGVDKSLFARQVEKHADVYTSRVSNFRAETPYGYLRAARVLLPHETPKF